MKQGMNMDHLVSTAQITKEDFTELYRIAAYLEEELKRPNHQLSQLLADRIMATLFYEPSTRTRLSFESAMHRLGGRVISTENALSSSSAFKGETLEDTIRIVSGYADVIVLRHPTVGSAEVAAKYSSIPTINAGDGAGEHPTQALLDLYTIQKVKGALDGLRIALVGDLMFSRTIHSLVKLLTNYDVKFDFVSPESIRAPRDLLDMLEQKGRTYEEHDDLQNLLDKGMDILYQTRIQKERFVSEEAFQSVFGKLIIDKALMGKLPSECFIMHPLPRYGDIDSSVDDDPRALYFQQAQNGVYVRMALLLKVFGVNV
jgi:aspartate carbamoyltransferase catalytic subunit